LDQDVIHDGPRYRVVHQRAGGDFTVVGFDHLHPVPSRDKVSTAAAFFGRHGIDFVGIQPARNDWFQDDEILDAIDAIRDATEGARRVGFGASMGGFGAIAFAEDLGFASVVALAPQYSIQPERVPFERRFREHLPGIAFRHDKIDRIAPIRAGYVMFDPAHIDREHYRLIARRHRLRPVPVYFTGHDAGQFLARAGMFGRVLLSLIEGRFRPAAYAREVRMARRNSNIVWLGAARALLRRGALARAEAAVRRAYDGPSPLPTPYAADVVHAEILRRLGRADAADALLAPHLANPAIAGLLRWYLDAADLALLDFI
jgi:hypothetical protein